MQSSKPIGNSAYLPSTYTTKALTPKLGAMVNGKSTSTLGSEGSDAGKLAMTPICQCPLVDSERLGHPDWQKAHRRASSALLGAYLTRTVRQTATSHNRSLRSSITSERWRFGSAFTLARQAVSSPHTSQSSSAGRIAKSSIRCQRRSKNRPCGSVKVCRLGWVRSLPRRTRRGPTKPVHAQLGPRTAPPAHAACSASPSGASLRSAGAPLRPAARGRASRRDRSPAGAPRAGPRPSSPPLQPS